MQMLYALVVLLEAAASVASQALPGCPSSCGLVKDIFYPFGIGEACHREGFQLQCNNTFDPPRLFLGDYEIIEMLPLQGQLRSNMPISHKCYDKQGALLNTSTWRLSLRGTPVSFSADRNRFVVTGCDTEAYLSDRYDFGFFTGCLSVCSNLTKLQNYSCSGVGCCQTNIPVGLKYFEVDFNTFYNHTRVWSFNPCSYALLVEENVFNFTTESLAVDYTYEKVWWPFVLDWSIEGETDCEAAKENTTSYACRSRNSECVPSNNGLGYLCNCSEGYTGNPYLHDGCKDVDECAEPDRYTCHGDCANTNGGYNCTCKPGYQSDNAKTNECTEDPTAVGVPLSLKLGLGLTSSLIFILLVTFLSCWGVQKVKISQLKKKLFEQNGGLYLQQYIISSRQNHEGSSQFDFSNMFKIHTLNELERATKDFDKSMFLGRGGHGTVYKGTLDNEKEIAVKKTKTVDESRNKEFAREMFILSQINHVNVVKLLGCCLEVDAPMLVYQYMEKGTLFQLLHERNQESYPTPWSIRLRIATESAKAFAYLHSEASPPILHGDIKSSNILLDGKYTAKVSDFGTSTLAPNDKAQLMTLVQGTCGYLDPEYMQTSELTEKSDVYSFGVVLAELLTGQKAINKDGKSLSSIFISRMKSDKLLEILDAQILVEENLVLKQVHAVANIAMQCLSLNGEQRPTMTTVSRELEEMLRHLDIHPWAPINPEETERLLSEHPSISETVAFPNKKFHAMDIEGGR